jgi:ATP-binding cassette subfamily B protein
MAQPSALDRDALDRDALDRQPARPVTFLQLIAILAGWVRPHRRLAVCISFGLLVDATFFAAVPVSFKLLLDRAVQPRDSTALAWILAGLTVALLGATVVGMGRDYWQARLDSLIQNDLRLTMFSHLQELSMDYYHRAGVGDVLANFSSDLDSVESWISSSLPDAIVCVLLVVVSVVLLFVLYWPLALVTAFGLPLCAIGPRLLREGTGRANYELRREKALLLGAIQENLHAQAVVKAYGLQESTIDRFRQHLQRLLARSVRFDFLSALVARSPVLSIALLQLVVVGSGALLAVRGTISVGTFVACYALFQQVYESVEELTQHLPDFLDAAGGVQRIDELLGTSSTMTDADDATELTPLSSDVVFENVDFSYDGHRKILGGISLRIPAGHSVAFVGPSGSGKSTVLNLLVRFFDPTSGAVRFDGVDIVAARQDSLRSQIGIVFQESFLFKGTIRENIAIGRFDASDDEIAAAAKAAELHDFINSLPAGYDTLVAERGGGFSGGQRQRMAIARAVLRDPALLLLDEATSALDPGTEAEVNKTLVRLAKGRTVASVTHRLQSVVGADEIFVLDGGHLVDHGTHDELIGRDGLYRHLWDKQHGMTVSADGSDASVEPDRLRTIPIIGELNEALLADVAGRLAIERVEADQVVISEGDPGDRFYILVRGKVEVTRRNAAGAEVTVGVLDDGDHFGEMALLEDAPRSATVRTLEPSVLLTLDRRQFNAALRSDADLKDRITAVARARRALAP